MRGLAYLLVLVSFPHVGQGVLSSAEKVRFGNDRYRRTSSSAHAWTFAFKQESWDWSWDELAAYDIPAFLQFVRTATGVKVLYVGHSQVLFRKGI